MCQTMGVLMSEEHVVGKCSLKTHVSPVCIYSMHYNSQTYSPSARVAQHGVFLKRRQIAVKLLLSDQGLYQEFFQVHFQMHVGNDPYEVCLNIVFGLVWFVFEVTLAS